MSRTIRQVRRQDKAKALGLTKNLVQDNPELAHIVKRAVRQKFKKWRNRFLKHLLAQR